MTESAGAGVELQLIARDRRSPSRSRRPKNFIVEVVKFKQAPHNKENPYARFSTTERYEITIKYLAEIWNAISNREIGEARNQLGLRKVAA